ncbi:hypothetical protein [Microbacterium sp. NPDC089695]|uniref:hypothetical protein n=1 Tax=Microbacterium sp. NPDC089695 TaxID=3364198 RepID=UPI0037FAD1DE
MTSTRKPAVVRGLVASSVAIFVALAGHVSGGGAMPGALGILVPWMLSFAACVLLAGRRLSLIRLALSVGVSQFLFHTLFVLGTITPSGAAAPHVHGAPLVLPAVAGATGAVVADGGMWVGHLIAALVTVAALHRGERLALALYALAAQAVRWVRRRVDVVLTRPALPRVGAPRAVCALVPSAGSALLATLRGRAPPLSPAI